MSKLLLLAAAGAAAAAIVGSPVAKRAYHAAHVPTARPAASASPPGAVAIDPKIVPPTRIGMNLGTLSYYSPEQPFYDPMKAHADFMLDGTTKTSSPITDIHQIKRDADGTPVDVPKDTILQTSINEGKAPLLLDCTIPDGWDIADVLSGRIASRSGRQVRITAPGEVWLKLRSTRDGAGLVGLACVSPKAPAGALYRPDFLADLKPFRILRFMNWMKANSVLPGRWVDRPTPEQLGATLRGMPVEYMVTLANLDHSDPWFTLPLRADDDYQRRFATYVRDHLDPGLKAYVELSNEIWNDGFPQSREVSAEGKRKYPSLDAVKQNDFAHADRVRHMMQIWTEVFAGQKQRLVRVLANQNWAQRGDNALGHEQTWKWVDALAVAPYIGGYPDVPGSGKVRIDGIFAKLPGWADEAIDSAKQSKIVANRYGLRLIGYEGGPGLVSYEPTQVKEVMAVYHDPRIVPIYTRFLERWRTEIGDDLVLYEYTTDGFWSHQDYTGQPLSEAPKMKTVVDFIQKYQPAR